MEYSVMISLLNKYKFTLIFGTAIIIISLLPSSDIPDTPLFELPGFDKLVHLTMYTVLFLTALLETRCTQNCLGTYILWVISILVISGMLEVLQIVLSEGRSGEWLDLAANASGVLFGFGLFQMIRFLRS